ncbi:uncharacterized protein LOC124899409 [Capsicum annuum]|uniref:uncharacterized protein LOC124899409 n=1 Tax=Capsicum annuum TaxID=4072 RepID=UPI001FB132B9|nr:uncharacterized protein LOC124899409 [Capsicum annuum]
MKWLWRFASGEQALWKDIIKLKYEMDGHWTTKLVTSTYGVGLWRAIRNLWPKLRENCGMKMENGMKVFFWDDRWLEQGTLKDLFPDIYILNQQENATVTKAVLTKENLMKRGFNPNPTCFLCEEVDKTVAHLFLHCRITSYLWKIFINMKGLHWVMPKRIVQTLKIWSSYASISGHKERWKIIPAFGGPCGKKEISDASKTSATTYRR